MIFVNEQKLKKLVAAAVTEALTVEWTIERKRDPATGMPLAVPQVKTENVFLPSAIVQMLPYHEGALRGLQEDIGQHNISVTEIRRLAEIIKAARPVLERLALAMEKSRPDEITEGDPQ